VQKNKVVKWLLLALYACTISFVALYSYRHPGYNWDMLAYMGLIVQKQHVSADSIHAITYAHAKAELPPVAYETLTSGEERQRRLNDAALFYRQLRFHAIKPLYIESIHFFYATGFSLPASTVMPSVVAYVLFGCLLLFWLLRWLPYTWAVASGLLIMTTGMLVNSAQRSTPDMLSAFLLLTIFYIVLEKPRLLWCLLLILLAMFVRLDNIIPGFFMLTYFYFRYRRERQLPLYYYLSSVFVIGAGYFTISYLGSRPFNSSFFFFDWFIRQYNVADGSGKAFSLSAYFAQMYAQLIGGILYNSVSIFLLVLLMLLYSPAFHIRRLSADQYFALLLGGIIMARFILFPDLTDRFNIAYYTCFLVLLLKRFYYLALMRYK
jgi:hypothetical protein